MPIYSTKEFKRIFNVTPQYISVNKKRGKLVVQGKYIDSDVPENKQWIEDWKIKNGEPESAAPIEEPKKKAKEKTKKEGNDIKLPPIERNDPEDIKIPELPSGPVDVKNMTRTELDQALKRINIKKAQEDLELARIKKQKMLGLVIPTDLVFGVFSRHFKSVTDSFYQAADNMLIELIPDRKDLGFARAGLVDIINKSIDEAKENTKKEIDALLAEYSESRGKGEKKN